MNVKELLYKCQADKTAVLATNFYNFETLTCVMKAAAKMEAPVLLQLTRSSIDYMGLEQACECFEIIEVGCKDSRLICLALVKKFLNVHDLQY